MLTLPPYDDYKAAVTKFLADQTPPIVLPPDHRMWVAVRIGYEHAASPAQVVALAVTIFKKMREDMH